MKGPPIHIRIKKRLPRNVVALLIVTIASACFLILINYFTIKTLSAVRAYTQGESRYSKGQKDAARNLIMFINTADSTYWREFENELQAPIGDSIARAALSNNSDDEARIKRGFLAGHNHPGDLDNMIWLFRNFKSISFMREAITIWKNADVVIAQEYQFAQQLRRKVNQNALTNQEKIQAIMRINDITTDLTRRERAFADILGETARIIDKYLFIFNLLMTIFIIGGVSLYANVMMNRLREKNNDLLFTNQELDRFVYSASHELRSPITSLKGLIEIARHEKDMPQIQYFLSLMNLSLDKQDQYIHDIIDFSRNKRDDVILEKISLNRLIDQAIATNQGRVNHPVTVAKEIKVDNIIGDSLRYKIIVNNVISNAIKFNDPTRESNVTILTRATSKFLIFEVRDNGIGIRNEDLKRIFDMFFVAVGNTGSGLGLYVTQQTVQRLRGGIDVESTLGIGSKFTVRIPLYYATLV